MSVNKFKGVALLGLEFYLCSQPCISIRLTDDDYPNVAGNL